MERMEDVSRCCEQHLLYSLLATGCTYYHFVDINNMMQLVANVPHIAEGGDYKARNLNLKQMFNRSTIVHFSTTPPLFAICCYVPFFFTNLN